MSDSRTVLKYVFVTAIFIVVLTVVLPIMGGSFGMRGGIFRQTIVDIFLGSSALIGLALVCLGIVVFVGWRLWKPRGSTQRPARDGAEAAEGEEIQPNSNSRTS